MAKKILIATPEEIPAELASDPDLIVLDPTTLPDECLMAIDEASGGMLSGGGPLSDWAGEEEREHGMDGDEKREDDEHATRGRGDDDGAQDDEASRGRLGFGRGDDDEDEKDKAANGFGRGDEADEKDKAGEGLRRGFGAPRRARGPAIGLWARSALGR